MDFDAAISSHSVDLTFPTDWTGYAAATPDNPSGSLTDFTLFLSLARLPAQWWAAVRRDGADIRVTDANNNLLPFDLIRFDYANNEGFLAFKATKGTGDQAFRFYAGQSKAGKFHPAHSLGRYNAYASHLVGFWPNGGGGDRTINKNHMAMIGGAISGDVDGPMEGSKATSYNGIDQRAVKEDDAPGAGPPTDDPFTQIGSWYADGYMAQGGSIMCICNHHIEHDNTIGLAPAGDEETPLYIPAMIRNDNQDSLAFNTGPTSYGVGEWHENAGVFAAADSRTLYDDGVAGTANTNSVPVTATPNHIHIATRGDEQNYFKGRLSLLELHNDDLSAAWLAYRSTMVNQSGFWNSVTWTAL